MGAGQRASGPLGSVRDSKGTEMDRRLAAIVAADVVGYSRLIRADEDGTLAALRALRAEVVDPAIARHQGRIVKLMGDGMLAEFASAADAVACSAEVQQAVAERGADVPEDRRIVFRIGVNLGDVVIDGDDIHGDGVNLAARLEALAAPGAVCISGAVHELVRDRLDLAFEDLGEREVKNIDRPIRVWQWGAGALKPDASKAPALPDKPSIAVLPFDNMSRDPDQEFFADGIAEDVITALSHDSNLFVIARNSSFSYRGRNVDIREIGRELGVRYVVEGSVRRAGNRVRITVQLIEATTGNHVWAERYDRPLDDVFEVQDEITVNIAGAVGSEILMADIGRVAGREAVDLESWERLMKARWLFDRSTVEDSAAGLRICREGIAAGTPGFDAMLVYGLGQALVFNFTDRSPQEVIAEAVAAGERALAVDPNNAVVHTNFGLFFWLSGDHARAIEHLEAAIRLNPNAAMAHSALGSVLGFSGAEHVEAARERFAHALRLAPRDSTRKFTFTLWSCSEYVAGNFEISADLARQAMRLDPAFAFALRMLAGALIRLDRLDDARVAAGRALELIPINPEAYVASMRRAFRKTEDAEHWLESMRLVGYLPK